MFRQQQKRRRPQHHWRTCRDEECLRPPCVAYKVGYEDGRAQGREEAGAKAR